MTVKSDVNEKANNIIFKKMDIITYVRTMILFDLLNQIILNDSKKLLLISYVDLLFHWIMI